MTESEQEKAVFQEVKRLDVSAMKTLNHLMLNATNEKVRLQAAHDWLEHRRELDIAALKSQTDNQKQPPITINIGDEKNVRAIRERILGTIPAELSAPVDAQ